MSKHNYTNPAFCQGSEFYPVSSASRAEITASVEAIYNRSLSSNYDLASVRANARSTRNVVASGPLRMQRSMSTRSVRATKTQQTSKLTTLNQSASVQQNAKLNRTVDTYESRSGSGRYALVPVEELATSTIGLNSRYAIVPGESLAVAGRFAKSQDNLDRYNSHGRLVGDDEPHSYHEEHSEPFISLPPMLNNSQKEYIQYEHHQQQKQQQQQPPPRPPARRPPTTPPKIKHAFSSDFGSKSFLLVDKNSNQRYQMVPTAEDEEIVDDNQEIIQMHNGRPHRYAVIPAEDDFIDDGGDDGHTAAEEEEETCLSTSDLHQSQNFLPQAYSNERTPLRTSTPQRGVSMGNLVPNSYPNTPLKGQNTNATKMLHELLSTPRKLTPNVRNAQTTPRKVQQLQQQQRQQQFQLQQRQRHQSQQQIYYTPTERKKELSPQRLHYETVKPATVSTASINQHQQQQQHSTDRTMAVITPRVASGSKVHPQVIEEEDCSSIHAKSFNNSSYPQKVANATITLAVVSLMLVLGSAMNSALIIYMIAHFGKSFYLQFSLVAAFCGVGLGFLGFRSRHCEWLPNRSYTSGYILVTLFCLLKCCGLLVILVLDPYPGLPLHDVTTGIILGLSTFTMFFIGLGVIGSLWCYRPPPDNRVNVV